MYTLIIGITKIVIQTRMILLFISSPKPFKHDIMCMTKLKDASMNCNTACLYNIC